MLIPIAYAKFHEYTEIPGAPESPGLRLTRDSKHTMTLDTEAHLLTIRHVDSRHAPVHLPLSEVRYMTEALPVSATAPVVEPVAPAAPVDIPEARIVVKTPPKGKLAPPDPSSDT